MTYNTLWKESSYSGMRSTLLINVFLFTISTIERKCDRTALFKSYVFTTVVRSYLMCHHIESRHHMSRTWTGINMFAQLFHVCCRWVFADKVVSYKRYDLWRNKTL